MACLHVVCRKEEDLEIASYERVDVHLFEVLKDTLHRNREEVAKCAGS